MVARRVRAWIETQTQKNNIVETTVARRVRAWIETDVSKEIDKIKHSRTPCACVD